MHVLVFGGIIGGITGLLDVPHELILGRRDTTGRLRIAGRTTALRPPTATRLGALLEEQAHAWPERLPRTVGVSRDRLHRCASRPGRRGVG